MDEGHGDGRVQAGGGVESPKCWSSLLRGAAVKKKNSDFPSEFSFFLMFLVLNHKTHQIHITGVQTSRHFKATSGSGNIFYCRFLELSPSSHLSNVVPQTKHIRSHEEYCRYESLNLSLVTQQGFSYKILQRRVESTSYHQKVINIFYIIYIL